MRNLRMQFLRCDQEGLRSVANLLRERFLSKSLSRFLLNDMLPHIYIIITNFTRTCYKKGRGITAMALVSYCFSSFISAYIINRIPIPETTTQWQKLVNRALLSETGLS